LSHLSCGGSVVHLATTSYPLVKLAVILLLPHQQPQELPPTLGNPEPLARSSSPTENLKFIYLHPDFSHKILLEELHGFFWLALINI